MAGGGLVIQQFFQVFTVGGSLTLPNDLVPNSVQGYCTGESGTAGTSSHGVRTGPGSGAGAFAGDPNMSGVGPGTVLTVTVPPGNTGNPTTITGGTTPISAAAGLAPVGTAAGVGGPAGSSPIAFKGGDGVAAVSGASISGSGGGGSAGSTSAGGNAVGSAAGTAGTGAAGPPSLAGAPGQAGAGALNPGVNGVAPGGGASGGGSGGSLNHLGGTGAPGQAVIIWSVYVLTPLAIPRRVPARAVIRSAPVATVNAAPAPPVSGTVQPPAARPAARRRRARALVQFRPVSTVNAAPAPPVSGTVQPRATVPVPRRRPTRALARGTAVPGVRIPAPRQLFQMPPRRRRARALVRFTAVRGANAIAPRTLLVSLASAAGVDDYGNAYPQGIFAGAGVIEGPTFVGSDYLSNAAGSFYYSGAPALGNLISSVAAADGTDAQGNAYLAGTVSYLPGGTYSAVAITGGAVAWFTSPGAAGPWTEVGVMEIALTSGNPLVFSFNSLGGNINMPQNAVFGLPLASPAPSSYNVVWGTQVVNAINNLYSMLQAAGVSF
jgi:hypothetical protein